MMLVALLSAFLGGLILNAMPCVFPIISLKAFGLVKQGANGLPCVVRDGLHGGLGRGHAGAGRRAAGAAGGGQAVGWGFQLQSPTIVALLALVMVGAALNLMGLFEMGLGLQRAGQSVGARDGILGAALTGALAVVVATPCAGPFMAGALGYALVQPPLAGLAIFAALAVGVAAPFTVLSFSPALARRLPPGAVDGHAQTCAGVSHAGRGGLAGVGAGCANGFGGAAVHSWLRAGSGVQRMDLWSGPAAHHGRATGARADGGGGGAWWRLAPRWPCRAPR
jgi:cytochrome c biogenesis protein CcdA